MLLTERTKKKVKSLFGNPFFSYSPKTFFFFFFGVFKASFQSTILTYFVFGSYFENKFSRLKKEKENMFRWYFQFWEKDYLLTHQTVIKKSPWNTCTLDSTTFSRLSLLFTLSLGHIASSTSKKDNIAHQTIHHGERHSLGPLVAASHHKNPFKSQATVTLTPKLPPKPSYKSQATATPPPKPPQKPP